MSDLDFYFDFSSPYGYLASERIDGLAERCGVTVHWQPYLIGAIFKQTGQSPLVEQPIRGDYFRHDMERCAKLQGTPFQIPARFPYAAIGPSRAFYWIDSFDPILARQFAHDIYRGYFADGLDMSAPETVIATATRHGINANDLRNAMSDPKWKQHLRDVITRAVERGAFGSPFFFYEDEPFFGNDRMDQLEQWIKSRS